MQNNSIFSLLIKIFIFLYVTFLVAPQSVNAVVVDGFVVDQNSNPVTNIRVKVRKGTKNGGNGAFAINWYYEEKFRIKTNDGYFVFKNVSESSDSNDVCMLYTLSGASTNYNTAMTDHFILNGDTTINLTVSEIIYGSLAVKLIDSLNNQGLQGAVVAAGLLVNAGEVKAGITDNSGWILLDKLISGTDASFRMTANCSGYAPVSIGFKLNSAAKDTLILKTKAISTPQTGQIHGIMTDTASKAIENGLVVLKFGNKENREFYVGITDSNGEYIITNIPEQYIGIEGKIEAGAERFQDIETSWVVDNNNIELNFELTPSGGDGNGTGIIDYNRDSKITLPSIRSINFNKNLISIQDLVSHLNYTFELFNVKGRKLFQCNIYGSNTVFLKIPINIANQQLFIQLRNNSNSKIMNIMKYE